MIQEMETKMIKRILMVVGLLACSVQVKANGVGVFETGYSTWTTANFTCSTGTPVDVSAFPNAVGSSTTYSTLGVSTASMIGFQPSLYKFSNQNSNFDVFFGPESNVSVSSTSVLMGDKLVGTSTGTTKEYRLAWNPDTNQPVRIFCIAQDGAGSMGVKILRTIFGYK